MDVNQEIKHISNMPNLSERLGKAGVDRIRAATENMPRRRSARGFSNTIFTQIQDVSINTPGISDVLSGVARTCGHTRPLNALRLLVIFQCLDFIDTKHVMVATGLSDRSSRDYVKACRMALPHLQKYFQKSHPTQSLPDYH